MLTLFNQGHQFGSVDAKSLATGLGGSIDGTLRGHGVYNEQGLVAMPSNLNYIEGSTLVCAGLTAWNALYGLSPLRQGDYVLTQGTGGVSIFALQFAKAAGAKVIATTSSAAKAATLKKLGADHVINYKETPEWGAEAKKLTPGGGGVRHVIEVGGPGTMAQSLQAVQIDGVISIIGFVATPSKEQPTFLDCLANVCTVRGLLVGSREQFEVMVSVFFLSAVLLFYSINIYLTMRGVTNELMITNNLPQNRAIEANDIKPVIDSRIFSLGEVKE